MALSCHCPACPPAQENPSFRVSYNYPRASLLMDSIHHSAKKLVCKQTLWHIIFMDTFINSLLQSRGFCYNSSSWPWQPSDPTASAQLCLLGDPSSTGIFSQVSPISLVPGHSHLIPLHTFSHWCSLVLLGTSFLSYLFKTDPSVQDKVLWVKGLARGWHNWEIVETLRAGDWWEDFW